MPLTAQEIIPSNIAKTPDIEAVEAALNNKALESTQVDIKALIENQNETNSQIKALNDTMLYFVTAMLEKMPRLDVADRAAIVVESGTLAVSTATNLTNLNNLAGGNTAILPFQFSNIGALHIYDNIKVS